MPTLAVLSFVALQLFPPAKKEAAPPPATAAATETAADAPLLRFNWPEGLDVRQVERRDSTFTC